MDKVALGQAFFPPNAPVCTCHHSTGVPYSFSSTCCSYRTEKRATRGKLPKSNAVARIGERSIENFLRFGVLKGLAAVITACFC